MSSAKSPPTKPGYHTTSYIVTDFDGAHVCTSKTPFYSAARALLKQGHDPLAVLYMHTDASPNWSLRAPLGRAAKLTVQENAAHGPRVVPYDGERLALLKSNRENPNGN
ncbi:hypothetical protein [Bosea sp. 685]|uniref:hypothetical protein n=1 Tax=Bosea sp. 685 TaxID=3080057 RepID=UPI0028931EE1|nr:hypothetical protein [Bosea sp. 685]WNJ91765.1 hypothetical protein RMR04_05515 [Bosea sp. 685]